MKAPNIIYFFCDDLGWGDVSCLNPESKIHTPNIDRLAARGVNFTNAHAGAAVCTPSRYALMTGRYAWRTAALKESVNGGYSPALIREGRRTVASVLARKGYHSACFGKWHIGMDWHVTGNEGACQRLEDEVASDIESRIDFSQPVANGPTQVGFDTFFGISASLDMPPYVWIENDRVVAIPDAVVPQGTGERRARRGLGTSAWKHEDVLPTLVDRAVAYIAARARSGEPFFLYLPVNGPHTPIVPNTEWIGRSGCGPYGDFVMEIDHALGRVMQAVEEAGITDNTMVHFASDNGPETLTVPYRERYGHYSAWRFRGVKRDNWEGGHRIPYIVSWPGTVPAGRIVDRFVELVDFAATVCDITGIPVPEDFCEDSFSMWELLQGRDDPCYREYSLHHSFDGRWAARHGPWKALFHAGSGGNPYDGPENREPAQLYNMDTDPFETINVYRDHPEIVAALRGRCIGCIEAGRSTPGPAQHVETAGPWRQLQELLAQPDVSPRPANVKDVT